MAKRENRLAPIQHEMRQVTNLKTLQPNATEPGAQSFSDCLIDIAVAALEEVAVLESGEQVQLKRLDHLMALIDQMIAIARDDGGSGEG